MKPNFRLTYLHHQNSTHKELISSISYAIQQCIIKIKLIANRIFILFVSDTYVLIFCFCSIRIHLKSLAIWTTYFDVPFIKNLSTSIFHGLSFNTFQIGFLKNFHNSSVRLSIAVIKIPEFFKI